MRMTAEGPVATIEAMTRSYLRRIAIRFIPLWVAAAAIAATLLVLPPVSDRNSNDTDAAKSRAEAPTTSELAANPDTGEPLPIAISGLVFAPDIISPSSSVDSSGGATAPPPIDHTTDGTNAPEVAELSVAYAVWASRTGGTPLAGSDIPAGSLPVGQRGGVLDKATFVRLQGSGSAFTLSENPDGRRTAVGEATVEVCQITERGWDGTDGMPLSDAPRWDPDACVAAAMSESGTWTFDLTAFEQPSDDRGFALVPAVETVDFQVTFVLND